MRRGVSDICTTLLFAGRSKSSGPWSICWTNDVPRLQMNAGFGSLIRYLFCDSMDKHNFQYLVSYFQLGVYILVHYLKQVVKITCADWKFNGTTIYTSSLRCINDSYTIVSDSKAYLFVVLMRNNLFFTTCDGCGWYVPSAHCLHSPVVPSKKFPGGQVTATEIS